MIPKNQLKHYTSLKQKKYREQYQEFIIEGLRLCEEAVNSDYELISLLYCPAKITSPRAQKFITRCIDAEIPVEKIDPNALGKISDTVHSQGVVGIAKIRKRSLVDLFQTSPTALVALDSINDPGNLGTILRTASWFGVDGILISTNSVESTNPKVVRASMGSIFHLAIVEEVDLTLELSRLQQNGFSLYACDSHGIKSYREIDFVDKYVIILGNEIAGISADIKNMSTTVTIPGRGKAESLNVAVAAGIILAETTRRN